jgi:hypothetical protein
VTFGSNVVGVGVLAACCLLSGVSCLPKDSLSGYAESGDGVAGAGGGAAGTAGSGGTPGTEEDAGGTGARPGQTPDAAGAGPEELDASADLALDGGAGDLGADGAAPEAGSATIIDATALDGG